MAEYALALATAALLYTVAKFVKLQAIEDFYQAVRMSHSLAMQNYMEVARREGKDMEKAWLAYPDVVAELVEEVCSPMTLGIVHLMSGDFDAYVAAAVAQSMPEDVK
ncbi:MAG: hypothetical protein ACI4L8_10480 [Candidatus Fimadaptatus sp.]